MHEKSSKRNKVCPQAMMCKFTRFCNKISEEME